MTTSVSIEHLFDRVQLVRGKGDRKKRQLCVMSFAALLAGERHTDAPATASLFIRHYAIVLNDAMPEVERQRLKLFAPRIVGTNDDRDGERAQLVATIFVDEILPRLQADLAVDWLPKRLGNDWLGRPMQPQEFLVNFARKVCDANGRQGRGYVARIAARLLTACAIAAPNAAISAWYWSKTIDVLDHLCDIAPTEKRAFISQAQVTRADYMLDHPVQFKALVLLARNVLRINVWRHRHAPPVESDACVLQRAVDLADVSS